MGKRAGKRGSSISHVQEQDALVGEGGIKGVPLLRLEQDKPSWAHCTAPALSEGLGGPGWAPHQKGSGLARALSVRRILVHVMCP